MSGAPASPVPWSGFDSLVSGLARVHEQAQQAAARSVDEILTLRSWLIGIWIVTYEQRGSDRAKYGARLIESLAEAFRERRVSGLGARNLKNCRQIAVTWPRLGIRQTTSAEFGAEIRQTLSAESGDETPRTPAGESAVASSFPDEWIPIPPAPSGDALPWHDDDWMRRLRTDLSFSQLLELSRIDAPLARAFYELETVRNRWSVRELKRQRDSMLFERVGLSKDKKAAVALARSRAQPTAPHAVAHIVRDPYVLEFLGLEGRMLPNEKALESALLTHLQAFLLELGAGFTFVGRQYRITVGGRHNFIDLVFYHRGLRCLVAIELKLGRFAHEHAGQMNFYLNWLRENATLSDESPPIGIILCADKDAEEVHYATGGLDHQVFVSRYMTALPSEDQLRQWLAEEREVLARAGAGRGEENNDPS